ncbi:MAG: bifunctional DNA-formamidopyrimidine glycosylase/DNA-(apurinic or apyrimidinic site) lyase [Desulfovibrionaceae bacterium]
MPELPEVETIARGLAPELAGRTVVAVELRRPASVQGDAALFRATLPGSRIADVGRRAKLLLVRLDRPAGGRTLAFHLKMTGRCYLPEPDAAPGKHAHLVFALDNGRSLFFEDARTFGYCRLFGPGELEGWDFYRTLGPEPLEIGAAAFAALFAGRRGRIKALLMDQTVLAGIGNIYADETLFRAGIRPDTPADRVPAKKLKSLHGHVQAVLAEAIAACGSSISDYRDAHGNAGAFQNTFQAYGRAGAPCVRCATPLVAIKVAGRTSTYCPHCQR